MQQQPSHVDQPAALPGEKVTQEEGMSGNSETSHPERQGSPHVHYPALRIKKRLKAALAEKKAAKVVEMTEICGLSHHRPRGVIDLQDKSGQFHTIRVRLLPSNRQVRQVLEVCRSVLSAMHAERMLAGWWHIMQWLKSRKDIRVVDMEWMGLVIQLFTVFLALRGPEASTPAADWKAPSQEGGDSESIESKLLAFQNSSTYPSWMQTRAWKGFKESPSNGRPQNIEDVALGPNGFLSRHIEYAKQYMASPMGSQAVGSTGYLPTSTACSDRIRRAAGWATFMALHLLVEEWKLDIMLPEHASPGPADLRVVLCQLARWLQWPKFASWYELSLQDNVGPQLDQGKWLPRSWVVFSLRSRLTSS